MKTLEKRLNVAQVAIENIEQSRKLARECAYNSDLIAQRLGISRRHLRRYVQGLFRCSPRLWLNECRMRDAVELLKKERSVKVVSNIIGFKQASHFSRVFKQYWQQSPKEFLKYQFRLENKIQVLETTRIDQRKIIAELQ